jgi:hypothetical protein
MYSPTFEYFAAQGSIFLDNIYKNEYTMLQKPGAQKCPFLARPFRLL